ncbi:MAG: single-stranded DNA-binding protein [Peptococcaceae bacterium]|nr:single-stranded DNA-binding protein [Peptococcaceae bacterium]
MAINTIALSGRLVAAPELRYTQNGTAVATGRIAVDDGYGEHKKTFFFDYTAWTHTAEYMTKYADKGTPVTIGGKLTQQTWQTQNGDNRSRVVIVVQEVVLPPRNNTAAGDGSPVPDYEDMYGEEITFDDSDLPF